MAALAKEETMTTKKLEDPTAKYPKPPFRKQSQPWPGLARKMDPRPDHGEKTANALFSEWPKADEADWVSGVGKGGVYRPTKSTSLEGRASE